MAHPAKPATEHGARTDPTTTDVGGLDPAGVRAVGREGDTSPAERLAALGGGAGATDEALHGEESTTGTPVSVGAVLILLEQQRFRCALTGRSLTPDVAALDHILPVRLGGAHAIENVQVLHRDVNRAKNSMTNDEFIQLCRDVVAWVRRRA
jgi:hypothetical protein